MILRYSRPEMAAIWSDETRLVHWLEIECLACEAMEELGLVPSGTGESIRKAVDVDPTRVAEIERSTRHDLIAFLTHVEEQAGEPARHLHLGMTSSDVLDTALAFQMVQAARILLQDLASLKDVLHRRAWEFKDQLMIGRTHGMHAEPTTFGLKLALWYGEFARAEERLTRAMEGVRYGMVSGAVGTYAHLSPKVEEFVCERLGLRPAPASSQIIPSGPPRRVSLDVGAHGGFNCQRSHGDSGIYRVRRWGKLLRVSVSPRRALPAMPHKRNPVTSEQLVGLARLVGSNASAALQNIPLWHERDISHSSVERVILPDSTILVDYMLAKLTDLLDRLEVNPEGMKRNLESTRDLFHSEQVLLALIRSGIGRQAAYEIVQRCAFRALEGRDFRDVLASDPDVTGAPGSGNPGWLFQCGTPLDSCRPHIRQGLQAAGIE